jgi:hypothetical protein
MAHLALLREPRFHVVWVVRVVEIGKVAGHASGIRQLVVPVEVTLRAIQRDVRARQRPPGLAMVESRSGP